MSAPKKPQDRLPKKSANVYRFTHEGVTYTLPNAAGAVDKIPGRALRDAYLDGQDGQMRLGFMLLEHVDADSSVIDVLYDMPAPMLLEHLSAWMEVKPDDEGATVGESFSSSA